MDNEKEKEQVFGFCGGKCGEDPCLAWNRAHGRNLTTLDTVEDAAWVEAIAFAKNDLQAHLWIVYGVVASAFVIVMALIYLAERDQAESFKDDDEGGV